MPCYWDPVDKNYGALTETSFDDVLADIFKMITQNNYLDSKGQVRGSAYIVLRFSYEAYDRCVSIWASPFLIDCRSGGSSIKKNSSARRIDTLAF